MQERKRSGRPLSEDGKLVIFPGTALETYKDATESQLDARRRSAACSPVSSRCRTTLSMPRVANTGRRCSIACLRSAFVR